MAAAAVRFGAHLKEIRIHLCQKSPASKGVRDFIEKHYVQLKKENPMFPFLIRECSNVQPRVIARYGFGKETSLPLSNLDSQQVLRAVEALAKKV
ncbi:NADH dehydrogenase [ubiquinone] 1 alpha subcomplex subunit 2-like [Pomacea canaliculata]|uniref:NADH dehydrogenase [ubiquinone] 1 alpha subcomplex subunit 2-like n=1 Tax=Pomacea canaliculata TaxID=400727 RepID=UPI000D734A2E|nr:NADH dehydrogenase [ubiquinone] 1 alpha subcomplex subunit 2-like [Pomacea canaliculata]